MTASILLSELSTLLQDTKRKHPDIRTAAEKSLSDLKALSITSEAQLAGDLVRKTSFIEPFILASKSQNGKLAPPSVVCLQRLVAGGAIPRERLRDVLEAFREFATTGLDSQLKVLQSLPAILQTYQTDIRADSLFLTLEICGILASNKSAVIASTAAATFQQLVSTVFEKVSNEDDDPATIKSSELKLNDQTINVGPSASDAYNVLNDLCIMLEGNKAQYIGSKPLPISFNLEVLESVVANFNKVFRKHGELIYALRKRAIAASVNILSDKQPFKVSVRAMRLLSLMIRNHLDVLNEDGEMILSYFIYLLDADAGSAWKRILSMEAWKSIYSEIKTLRLIFTKFDLMEGRKNVLQDHMAAMVRIASERPAVIGLSHQSTVPQKRGMTLDANDEQASIEALGTAGIVGSAVSAEANVTGISTEWSIPKTAFLEQLDKNEPPPIPDTYIYSLVLGLLGSFSENLTRYIMPFSVPKEVRSKKSHHQSDDQSTNENSRPDPPSRADTITLVKRKSVVLLNPLAFESHPQLDNIKATASMIDKCWPAFLATCSTFFYAALDGEHYHGLVRAFQKLTQVAGILRLDTPRDAMLTGLGKAAVPADALDFVPPTPIAETPGGPPPSNGTNPANFGPGNPPIRSPTTEGRPSVDHIPSALTTRNLLCLRALLNLGIALGPTLDVAAWTIILATLQQSEFVIKLSILAKRRRSSATTNVNIEDEDILKANLGAEISAVQGATKKMLIATTDYPTDAFLRLLEALCVMAGDRNIGGEIGQTPTPVGSGSQEIPRRPRRHQTVRSISISLSAKKQSDEELDFLLDKLPTLLASNKDRLAMESPESSGWSIISRVLSNVVHDPTLHPEIRSRSADLLGQVCLVAMTLSNTGEPKSQAEIQKRGLTLLKTQLRFPDSSGDSHTSKPSIDVVLHGKFLHHLETILHTCGEDILAGWNLVFDIVNSVFVTEEEPTQDPEQIFKPHRQGASVELIRASFKSLQLLGSDYLDRLPSPCIFAYVTALHDFGAQTGDLNIALTSTTSFLSLVEFLKEHMDGAPHLVETSSLIEQASSKEIAIAANALWITAMQHLSELALDDREDVRNAATTLLLRIFENDVANISAEMWKYCSEAIFLRLLNGQCAINPESTRAASWIDSSIHLLEGFMRLLVEQITTLVTSSNFGPMLNDLFETFLRLSNLRSLKMDKTLFDAISSLLQAIRGKSPIIEDGMQKAWSLWAAKSEHFSSSYGINNEPNQAAITSYVDCLLQICQSSDTHVKIVDASLALSTCETIIFTSRHPPYTKDVSKMSQEQQKVLDLLELLYPRFDTRRADYFRTVIKFIIGSDPTSAKSKLEPSSTSTFKAPTLIAFSGAVLKSLTSAYSVETVDAKTLNDWAILEVLQCLHDTITCKNGREVKGEPPLWQLATLTATHLIEHVTPVVLKSQETYSSTTLNAFAKQLTGIVEAVLDPSPSNPAVLGTETSQASSSTDADEFDIKAFRKLHVAIMPLLSSSTVQDSIRRSYGLTLFRSSLIFRPFMEDLPRSLETESLTQLYAIRTGYVDQPMPMPRPDIAYIVLDTLFSLSAGQILSTDPKSSDANSSENQAAPSSTPVDPLTLSQAAVPYAILRTALPIKTFIADQPLRGLTPISPSTTYELVYLINQFISLNCIDDAVPALPKPRPGAEAVNSTISKTDKPTTKPTSSSSGPSSTSFPEPIGKSHLAHLHPLMLEFWNILKRIGGDNKILWDAVDRWMREGAVFSGAADGISIQRHEWWR